MLSFKIYNIGDNGIEFNSVIEIDPKSSKSIDEINYLYELKKNKKVYVYPQDLESVAFLMKPRPRGRARVPDEVIIYIHVQFVEHKVTPMKLSYMIYKKYGVELKMPFLKSILSQEKYTDVDGIDDLREQAKERMPKKTGRKKKITDDVKNEVCRMYEEQNMSGNAISKVVGISSMSANTIIRERFGYRKKLNRVVAAEITDKDK